MQPTEEIPLQYMALVTRRIFYRAPQDPFYIRSLLSIPGDIAGILSIEKNTVLEK